MLTHSTGDGPVQTILNGESSAQKVVYAGCRASCLRMPAKTMCAGSNPGGLGDVLGGVGQIFIGRPGTRKPVLLNTHCSSVNRSKGLKTTP